MDDNNANVRLAGSHGPSPIGSERGNSPGAKTTKLMATSVSSLPSASTSMASALSEDSIPPRNSSQHSPVSPAIAGDDLSNSGLLDAADKESSIKARIERKRLEHERQRLLQRQAFEEQMKMLERKQLEEEANLLRQEGNLAPGQGRAPSVSFAAASAPSTPPYSSDRIPAFASVASATATAPGSFRGSRVTSPNPLGSGLNDLNDTEDGLNGSNVPGLPPLSSVRSVPSTRRTSREIKPSQLAQRDALAPAPSSGPRRSMPGPGDLATSFNRMALGGGGGEGGGGSRSGVGSLIKAGADQQEASAMTPGLGAQKFLFDDELDAPDSAFNRKYNLSGDDDKFPVLLRNDKFQQMPSQLSTSSAALDLAPLSQTRGPAPGDGGAPPHLSEWPQFDNHRQHQQIGRGRSERTSPHLGAGGRVPPSGSGSDLANLGRGNPTSPIARFAGPRAASGGVAPPRSDRDRPFPPFGTSSGDAPSQPNARLGGGSFNAGPTRAASGGSRPPSGYFQAFGNGTGMESAFGGGANIMTTDPALDPPGRKGELDINTRLEDLKGDIFTLCKDQHGCRYLQKKLEEGVPAYRDMIFAETFNHFAELMTDPFGNYLCQKMLEYCTDEQRNLIVESVSNELVTISLNMHGTRAVQKTIDFLSTSRQIHSIILALGMNVVTLIKDLNGNHVIQKCLNRLSAEDNQFIYNAVAAHCVEVATHRHGCCVLQRCVDHASDKQRVQLVQEITYNALTLVQDPFGNYVVQYILDLNDARFTEAIIRQFIGNVCLLSVQKFSSNVIEKCIRVADGSLRSQLVEELLNRARLEKLLRDSFANYVVQTALDYSEPMQRAQLVECIRPILPMIRNTPYGKRIQSKLQRDTFDSSAAAAAAAANVGLANVPYHLIQAAQVAAHQQQLQMAAMAAAGHGHHAHPHAHGRHHPMDYAAAPYGPGRGGNPYAGPYNGPAGGFGGGANRGHALPAPHQLYGHGQSHGHGHASDARSGPMGRYPSSGSGVGGGGGSGGGGYHGNGAVAGGYGYGGAASGAGPHQQSSGYGNHLGSVGGYGQGGPF